MARKKRNEKVNKPYWVNPDIYFSDFYFDGELVKPGTNLKIKNESGEFRFIRFVCNKKTETEWIDVIGQYGWKSVRPDKIKGMAIKKSYAKKKGK